MFKIRINFLLALGLLTLFSIAFVSVLTYQQIRSLRDAIQWLVHTHEVIETSDEVTRNALLAKSVGQTFLLTGNMSYLREMGQYKKEALDNLSLLKYLTRDNPAQQKRIEPFIPIVNQYFLSLEAWIQLEKINHLDKNKLLDISNQNFLFNTQLSVFHRDLNTDERKLLETRTQGVVSHSQKAGLYGAFSNALCFIILAIVLLALKRQLQLRALDYQRIESVNKELEEFAYVASHDLKAPLRVIDNASKWLEEDLQQHLNDETRENMALLRSRVKRMEKLLDDLLEYSRIGRKTDERYFEMIKGDALMHNIIELLSPPAGFKIQVSPTFSTIHLPRMPLQQILMNLISNAIKHHDKKEGLIDVIVRDANDHYIFSVQDDGPGISPQFHEQIFKMFQTLKSRDQVEGSGMGLAMVRKNIEVFGGKVSLVSSEGHGSLFKFTWPKKFNAKEMTHGND